ncbi:DGQHR domain-containing protein [Sphingopyxis sp.]|uniref:DGQHR domain-containing protein n=1 Tax=Sphingopyxis sp. TaxID=1908224 RepID=UPI003D0B18DA
MEDLAEIEVDVMLEDEFEPYEGPSEIGVVVGPTLRSGTPLIVGMIPFGSLLGRYEIPYYNYTTKRGYQRQPAMSRVSSFATEIKKGRVDFPTAILLNIRSKSAISAIRNGLLSLSEIGEGANAFHVVDGQHRLLALGKAVDDGHRNLLNHEIPFTCMVGADEDEEMEQFYQVNSNAKAVRTDLAYALLKKRAETEDGLIEALEERGRAWQVSGQGIVERLAVESSVWKNRIRLPGMDKGETVITSASMVASLKPVLGSPYFSRLKSDQQLRVLEAFWEGIRNALRDAFDHPTDYSIQKGVGVIVMHTLMPEVLELVRDRGLSTTDPDAFEALLEETLTSTTGETAAGNIVEGVEFWAAGADGAAGQYSSSSGRRVLIAKLRNRLPQMLD